MVSVNALVPFGHFFGLSIALQLPFSLSVALSLVVLCLRSQRCTVFGRALSLVSALDFGRAFSLVSALQGFWSCIVFSLSVAVFGRALSLVSALHCFWSCIIFGLSNVLFWSQHCIVFGLSTALSLVSALQYLWSQHCTVLCCVLSVVSAQHCLWSMHYAISGLSTALSFVVVSTLYYQWSQY